MFKGRKIVMVLEGETEVVFYRRILKYLYENVIKNPCVPIENIDFILARGVGNIGVRAVQTFKMRYGNDKHREYVVFCCYDTDVFENGRMPRLWTQKTVNKFLSSGAVRVHNIRAKYMIEDWYLYDYNGILRFLEIPKNLVPKNPKHLVGTGADRKIGMLYRLARKSYQKGYQTDSLVSSLDIDRIYQRIKSEFVQLIKEIECENIG